jgi:hypothetical protein
MEESMSYNITPRRLWEMGVISQERLWQLTTPEERDQIVNDAVDAGRLSLDSEEYAEYYYDRMDPAPGFDTRQWSPEARAKLSWYDPDDSDY